MASKALTGWMLLIGPLLGFIMFTFVNPAGWEDDFAVQVADILDNPALATIGGFLGCVGMLAAMIGTAFLSRSMQGDQKRGSDLAGLAAVLALLSAGVLLVVAGLNIAIDNSEWIAKGGNAEAAYATAEGIWHVVEISMGGAILMLGIAILLQKNFHLVVGGITAILGACLVVGSLIGADNSAGEVFLTIGFLGWLIITLIIGGLILLAEKKASA